MAKKMIKSSKKTTKRLRKFEDGGMAGKGPLKPESKKDKTTEELAQETVSRLTAIPGVSKTESPSIVGKSPLQSVSKPEAPKAAVVAPKAKLLPGGFKDQAQKDAYIKSTKNLLKTKSVSDLVKMKHGTAAGLSSLGFKDEAKKATPVAKAPVAKAPVAKAPVAKAPISNNKTTPAKKSPIATYKASSKTAAKNLPGGGKLVTNINTKKDGSKQIKTTSYNKAGKAGKSLYKEILPRYGEDKKKGVKWAINKAGTKSTVIDAKTGEIDIRKGSGLQLQKSKNYATNSGGSAFTSAPGSTIAKRTWKYKGDKKTTSSTEPYVVNYRRNTGYNTISDLTPAQLKKKGQELKQKGIGQKRAGQLFKQMAKPRESFAKRHGLPEVSKKITEPLDIAMSFVAPAGRAKGATNLWQLGSKIIKGGAKTKAGAEAIKKTVEVVKKGAETSKKGADVIAKTSKTAKANRAAITRAQKGGLDKILRKGEGLPKVKDVVQKAANTAKSNRATITRKQKGGLDKMLKLGEGK